MTPHAHSHTAWPTPSAFFEEVRKATVTRAIPETLRPLHIFGAAGTDPDGGFSLPYSVAPVVLGTGPDVDPIADRVRRVRMNSSRLVVPARVDKNHTTSVTGGFQAVRQVGAMDPVDPTRGEVEQVILTAVPLVLNVFATKHLTMDSPQALASLIESAYRDEIGGRLLDERLNGTGVGEFEGILGADCTLTVSKEVGQQADTIVGQNVIAMAARCWRYSGAVWLANQECLAQLSATKDPVTGAPLLHMPEREEDPFMLLGRPLFFVESCQPLGDRGDLVLGVWSEYLEGEVIGVTGVSSLHVRFLQREAVFQFFAEDDGKPWWRSALTPKRSATTVSPFVVLEART